MFKDKHKFDFFPPYSHRLGMKEISEVGYDGVDSTIYALSRLNEKDLIWEYAPWVCEKSTHAVEVIREQIFISLLSLSLSLSKIYFCFFFF